MTKGGGDRGDRGGDHRPPWVLTADLRCAAAKSGRPPHHRCPFFLSLLSLEEKRKLGTGSPHLIASVLPWIRLFVPQLTAPRVTCLGTETQRLRMDRDRRRMDLAPISSPVDMVLSCHSVPTSPHPYQWKPAPRDRRRMDRSIRTYCPSVPVALASFGQVSLSLANHAICDTVSHP